ncbi:MAG TPA: hypothetical protein VHO91_04655, partial [Rhodopila sp.]|nr:hypothetical protein [Rhodopila sp.]
MSIIRFFTALYVFSAFLLLIPRLGVAQSVNSPPLEMTAERLGTRPNDVYSPRLIYQTING